MHSDFVVIGAFDLVADAELLKLKLESEGIPVLLKDANILQAEPFIAAAIGGVKVMVPRAFESEALQIYGAVRAYALDKAGNPVVCPNCKATRSERYHSRSHWGFRLFPFLEPVKYICLKCGMITRRST